MSMLRLLTSIFVILTDDSMSMQAHVKKIIVRLLKEDLFVRLLTSIFVILTDDTMSMQAHVKKICQTAYVHLRNINR